ncbi:MAG TPA: CRISPR-associated helicase Cas3' [Bacillota bacterium]|nr:CRISPR-associated helicase Cas3' [Bacillota bacterium]
MLSNNIKLQTELNKLFGLLTSDAKITLYPYQNKVVSEVIARKNILLRAPTGAGKSWAALLPFIFGCLRGQPLFDRAFYILPLRSLAAQLYQITKEACQRIAGINGIKPIEVTIQTGEQQKDPFFQGDIIFTTIDQLLSSYLMNPISLPPRMANINAGALIGSLFIFDEFHLLDPERSMGTTIEMLDRLNGYCSFILMTATLSDNAINELQQRFDNTLIIDLLSEEIDFIESKKSTPTRRRWIYSKEELSTRLILDNHKNRTMVIANSVSRAQEIYKKLRDACRHKSKKTDIRLLHSRFFSEDRSRIEYELITRLGKANKDNPEDFIFVGTQVVEAGMDFTVDQLYSELAPINSLIQRAGRCARYGGEGTVTICPVSSYPPYSKEDMDATAALLSRLSGKVFDWQQERDAVNAVLGAKEAGILSSYRNLYRRRGKVNQALDGELSSAREELIRDVHSVNVVLTDKPEKIQLAHGSWPETLSVPVSSMHSFYKKMSGTGAGEWIIKVPYVNESSGEEDYTVRFNWREINEQAMLSSWLLAVNPKYACYSDELGLVLGKPGCGMAVRYRYLEKRTRYCYRVETYLEHMRHVLEQYESQEEKYLCSILLLARQLAISENTLKKAIKIALIMHDTGKLTLDWQNKARKWQEQKTPGRLPVTPLAHTDYDPSIDRYSPKFSNHAVEGAYAVSDYLFDLFCGLEEGIAACILTAIARHHTGHASKLDHFILDNAAVETLNRCLIQEGFPAVKNLLDKPDEVARGGEFSRLFISACNEDDSKWLPFYWYIVRRLRLADQAGTAKGGKK